MRRQKGPQPTGPTANTSSSSSSNQVVVVNKGEPVEIHNLDRELGRLKLEDTGIGQEVALAGPWALPSNLGKMTGTRVVVAEWNLPDAKVDVYGEDPNAAATRCTVGVTDLCPLAHSQQKNENTTADPLHKDIGPDYLAIPFRTTTASVDKWAIAQVDTVLSQLALNSRGHLEQHLEMFLVSSPEAKGGAQVSDVCSLLHYR